MASRTDRFKIVERVLTTCLVALKLNRLRLAWGVLQGFDAGAWRDVFRAVHWFEPLPTATRYFDSYHPPLSYLLARLLYGVFPHEVEVTQILATLAILGAVFALRSTLHAVGVLWTLPGLVLLYVAASIPLVVWLAIETGQDALVFMWFNVALAVSVRLFWDPPARSRSKLRWLAGVAILGLVFAGGLLTKFNTLFALGLPFLVVFARRGSVAVLRESRPMLAAAALGAALVAPLYYTRYYVPFHTVFPSNCDWLLADALPHMRRARDDAPLHFLTRLLRFPSERLVGATKSARSSLFHSIWFQLWKRDDYLGREPPPAALFSDLYMRIFAVLSLASSAVLLVDRRRIPGAWRSLGVIFSTTLVVYWSAQTYYVWKYPVFDWGPIKAKYVIPSVLGIAYAAALPLVNRSLGAVAPRVGAIGTVSTLVVIIAFMFINHLLPVY